MAANIIKHWSSFPKKDEKPRFCVNYIKLNAVTYTNAYPLLAIQDILDSLAGSFVVSTINLNSGYWQCLMEENSSLDSTNSRSCPLDSEMHQQLPRG